MYFTDQKSLKRVVYLNVYSNEPFSFEVPPVISSVSESTAQFLVAEKLSSTPIAEGEILAVMDHVKPPSQPSLLKRVLCPGRSALSIEEQKIFQSLDCLNQKLQSKLDNKENAT